MNANVLYVDSTHSRLGDVEDGRLENCTRLRVALDMWQAETHDGIRNERFGPVTGVSRLSSTGRKLTQCGRSANWKGRNGAHAHVRRQGCIQQLVGVTASV